MNREDNQLITKSNVLIQDTVDDLTRREQYLMAVLLAEFKAANMEAESIDDVTEKITTITLSELSNYIDIDIHSGTTALFKETIRHFQSRAFYWFAVNENDEHRVRRYPMFDYVEIPEYWFDDSIAVPDRTSKIKFKWNDEFIPLIIGNKPFTELWKASILSLKSGIAIKLYQLLKSFANKDWDTTITVAELRLKLGMTSKSYDRFDRFYDRGIQKPIDEINKHTEINVTAKKNPSKSDKRRIESITFKIKNVDKKHGDWDASFPNVKLTNAEYTNIKQWTSYPDWKRCCRDLQEKLDEGKDIRNHYKWILGHHRELEDKYQKTLTAQSDEVSDDEYRALFHNPYMNE